jgi:hypothetical protein
MAWYKTAKGWIATAIAVIIFVLTQWGNMQSAVSIYGFVEANFHSVLAWTPLAFFLLALYFFQQERQRSKGHDLSTLGGFALKLRDDLEEFVDRFPKPEIDITGVRNDDMLRKVERLDTPASLRASALEHGFYLRFLGRMEKVYHEFGRFGIQDRELTTARAERQFEMAFTYQIIMDALTRLSHTPEASEKMTPDN